LGTGPELWQQADGKLDAFVAIVGTGGTFVGTSRALKARSAAVRCLAVEPQGAQTLAGQPAVNPAHKLQGAGYAVIPPHWDPTLCDGTIAIGDDEAIQSARALANREGIVAGYSTGANVAAALRIATSSPPGFTVATIACDTGTRYLSGDLFAAVNR
jgi:cysteine synthase A